MPTPLLTRLHNLLLRLRARWTRYTRKHRLPQPDLRDAEVQLVPAALIAVAPTGEESREEALLPWFTDYPPDRAQREGWVDNLDQYRFLACASFALRYPNHTVAREFRRLTPDFTDLLLYSLLQGSRPLAASPHRTGSGKPPQPS